jgi:hypothetical protein
LTSHKGFHYGHYESGHDLCVTRILMSAPANRFALDALEPRILLSSGAVLAIAAPAPQESPQAALTVEHESTDLTQQDASLSYRTENEINDIFEGVAQTVLETADPSSSGDTKDANQQGSETAQAVEQEKENASALTPNVPSNSPETVPSGEVKVSTDYSISTESPSEQIVTTLKSANPPPSETADSQSVIQFVNSSNLEATASDGLGSSFDFSGETENIGGLMQSLSLQASTFTPFSPSRPLIFIPGFSGSSPIDSAVGEWLLNRGLAPDKLEVDPLANTYGDLIKTLENAGYSQGDNFFIANWDWRMAVAPADGTADGNISGLTAANLTDSNYSYGVDYLGYAIKNAVETWTTQHGSAPDSVDIVTHSTGGLIARAYIESPAYNQSFGSGVLPKVHDLFMYGVPNQGAAQVWNILNDNWASSSEMHMVSFIANAAYEKVLSGVPITGPDADITLASISTNGVADPKKFILQFAPSLRDLLPTFAFINDGTSTLKTLNNDSIYANKFLLDLNGGLDQNAFTNSLTNKLVVFYSSDQETNSSSDELTGGSGQIYDMTHPFGRSPGSSEVWYEDQSTVTGDGTVLASSVFGQFSTDTTGKISGYLETGLHTGLPSNTDANTQLLVELGIGDTTGLISTGQQYDIIEKLGQAAKFAFLYFNPTASASAGLTGSFTLPSIFVDDMLSIVSPTITFAGVTSQSDRSLIGTVTFTTSSASLFPTKSLSATISDGPDADAVGLNAILDLTAGTFTATGDQFSIKAGGDITVLSVVGSGITLSLTPSNPDQQLALDVQTATVNLLGLVTLQGGIRFEVGGSRTVEVQTNVPANLSAISHPDLDKLADADGPGGLIVSSDYSRLTGLKVNSYRLIGTNVSAFIGYGDPTFAAGTNAITNGDDLTGFGIGSFSFGLGIFTPQVQKVSKKGLPDFLALKGNANDLATYGLGEVLALDAHDISIAINTSAKLKPISVPDLHLPSFSLPTISLPDLVLPDLSLPKFTWPSISLPSISLPDFNIPNFSLPNITLPDFDWPSIDLPSFHLPTIDLSGLLPDIDLPSFHLPSISLPNIQLPTIDLSFLKFSLPNLDLSLPSIHLPSIQFPDIVFPSIHLPTIDLDIDLSGLIPKIHFPRIDLPSFDFNLSLPDINLPGFPTIKLPSLHLPTLHLPSIQFPDFELPNFDLNLLPLHLPNIQLPDLHLPSLHLPSLQLPDLDLSFLKLGDILFPSLPSFNLPSLSWPSLHLPTLNFPSITFPRLDLSWLHLPSIDLPSFILPSFSFPDITLPNLQLPNISFPDFDLIHFRLPSISLPSISFPDIDFPSFSLPSLDLDLPLTLRFPELHLPSFNLSIPLPSIDLPDINLSFLGFPNINFPTISLPSLSFPNFRLPDLSLPDLQLPSITLPDFDLPGIKLSGFGTPALDFQTSFPATTGANAHPMGFQVGNRVLDFNGEKRTSLIVNQLDLTVADVLDISGAVAFEFGPTYTINMSTGIPSNLGAVLGNIGLDGMANDLLARGGITIGQNFSTINGLEVGTITVGAAHLSGFLGYGDPVFDSTTHLITNSADLTGFALQDINLALAILKPTVPIKKLPKLFGLKATVGSLTTIGMDDVLDLQAQQISLQVNTGSKWPGKLGPPATDFLHSFPANGSIPAGLPVTMPLGMSPVFLDFDAIPTIALEIGNARIRVVDFLTIQGALRVEMGSTYIVNVDTGIPANLGAVLGSIGLDTLATQLTSYAGITIGPNFSTINGLGVSAMTIGASNLQAFVGVGNPDFSTSLSTQDLTGFALQNVTLSMAILKSTLPISKLPKFTALKATAGSFTTLGMSDVVDLQGSGVSLEVNTGSKWPGKLGPPTIDFLHSLPGGANAPPGLAVPMPLGGAPVYLDFDAGQRIALSINSAKIKLADFVYLQGGIRIDMGATYVVDVNTGIPANLGNLLSSTGLQNVLNDITSHAGVTIEPNFSVIHGLEFRAMTIGGTDISAFIGTGTPDFAGDLNTQDLVGFGVQHVNFGLGILKTTLPIPQLPKITALKATAGSFGLIGMGDVIQLQGSGVSLEVNTGSKWVGGFGPATVNFQTQFPAQTGKPAGLVVPRAGGASPIYLDFDGQPRIAVGVSSAKVDIAEFVHLKGGIRFEMGPRYTVDVNTGIPANLGTLLGSTGLGSLLTSITSNAGVTISNDLSVIHGLEFSSMTIGGTDLSAFIGVGSPNFGGDLNAQDLVGFDLQHVNFGLGILKSTLPIPQIPKITALKATAGSFGLLGLGDVLQLSGTGVSVEVNTGTKWPGGFGPATVNFKTQFPATGSTPAGLAVNRAGGGSPIYLDFDQQPRIAVGIDSATIGVADFVHIQGGIRFDIGPKYILDVNTGIPAAVGSVIGTTGLSSLLNQLPTGVTFDSNFSVIHGLEFSTITVAGTDLSAFVGVGNPDFSGNLNNQGLVGVALQHLDFGLALLKPTLPIPGLPKFTALKATAGSFGLVGMGDFIDVHGTGISVEVNTGTQWAGGLGTPTIDFQQQFPAQNGASAGLAVPRAGGVSPIYLDFDKNYRIAIAAQNATIAISNFFYISGSVAFEMGPVINAPLAPGLIGDLGVLGSVPAEFGGTAGTKPISVMTLGAKGVHGFFGMNGPDWTDANNNGIIDRDLNGNIVSSEVKSGAVGIVIDNLDLGLFIGKPTNPLDPIRYTALKASAQTIKLVGIDGVTASADGIKVELNLSSPSASGFPVLPVINFAGLTGGKYAVKTGAKDESGNPITIDLDMPTPLIRVQGFVNLNIMDIIYVSGSVAFELGPRQTVTLSGGGGTKTVTTMSIGIANATAFIGANGPYWTDTDHDHSVDQNELSSSAIGFGITDFDAGLLVMASTDPADLGAFVALKASVHSFGLVNIPGVTASGTFEVSLNLGTTLTTAVDFKTSFPATSTPSKPAGYQVNTGDPTSPVLLDFTGPLIDFQLAGTVSLFGLMNLDGAFAFELSPSRMVVFADAQASILLAGSPVISAHAVGLLYIANGGIGLSLDLSAGFNLASVLDFNVTFSVSLNTTATDLVFTVPDRLRSHVTYSSLTIHAGAPELDGIHYGTPGFYLVLRGHGSLNLASLITFNGDFYLKISQSEFEVQISATTHILIGDLVASGSIKVNSSGVVGSLQMAASAGLGSSAFQITGIFQLEINSTSQSQAIQTLNVSDDGSVHGLKTSNLSANTYRLVVGGQLSLLDTFIIKGRVEMVFSSTGFTLTFNASLDLGGFGTVSVSGGAAIQDENGTPVFAINLDLGANTISIPSVSIKGDFKLKVNTSRSKEYVGVDPGTVLVHIDADVQVLLFHAYGSVTIGLDGGVFKISLDSLDMSFFGIVTLHVNGYIKSNGDFLIGASVGFELDLGPFVVEGGFEVRFSLVSGSPSFYGRLYGSVGISIDFGLFSVDFTIASVEAIISFTQTSASAALTVTVAGIDFGGSISWSWGHAPIIAKKVGTTLVLNMGADVGGLDEGYSGGDVLYQNITDDSFTINHISGSAGNETVEVKSLGTTSTFSGISKILVNDGKTGNDYVYVSKDVQADVEIHGGSGKDTFLIVGSGTHIVTGGAGNDKIVSGSGADTIDGDGGDDNIQSAGGADTISSSSGNDSIEAGDGNDIIVLSSGSGSADGEAGNDTFNVSSGSYTLSGNAGKDVFNVTSGSQTILGGADNDVFNLNGGTIALTDDSGSDTVNITAGSGTINTGSGDDTINFNRPAQPNHADAFDITDDSGADVINIDMDSTGKDTVINHRALVIPGYSITFSSGINEVEIDDAASLTHVTSTVGGTEFDATKLTVNATRYTDDANLRTGALELNLGQNVIFNKPVTVTNDIVIVAGTSVAAQDTVTTGTLAMTAQQTTISFVKAVIVTNNAGIHAGTGFTASETFTVGSVTMTAGQAISFAKPLVVSNNATVTAGTGFTASDTFTVGSVTMTAGQAIAFNKTVVVTNNGDITSTNAGITALQTITAGGLRMQAAQGISLFANVTITGTSSGDANVTTGAARLIALGGSVRTDNTYFTAVQGPLCNRSVGIYKTIKMTAK